MSPGKVYLKRYVRQSKYDPLVDEVELIDANPNYATVRLQNGNEATVSLRHLAPTGDNQEQSLNESSPGMINPTQLDLDTSSGETPGEDIELDASRELESDPILGEESQTNCPRRSQRTRHVPKYLNDYFTSRRGECGE